jgi:NAD(P)-dependent dehydrogenase (short-subunit alcohol dehydrogenase family)
MGNKIWLVTGCSSGLGMAIARAVVDAGDAIAVTARDIDSLADFNKVENSNVLVTSLDVTDELSIKTAVEETVNRFGRIDILVNNAGYGYYAIFEQLDISLLKNEMEVNLYGVIRTSQAVLPVMRAQRSGHIINISSIAGSVGTAGRTAYSASKFAVSGISECLAREVKAFGINVTAIELGGMRTNFFDGVNLEFSSQGIDDYNDLANQLSSQFKTAHGNK